jgi:hypothetical protein
MTDQDSRSRNLRTIRIVLLLFIAALVASGITAFPLLHEMEWLASWRGLEGATNPDSLPGMDRWIVIVRDGLRDTYARYPWLSYGTDWLAFAHLAIAVFFIGPVIDPVRNVSVLWAGLIACAGIIPLALVCGSVRGIPMGWRMIDCSFGVFGALPLAYCLRLAKRLEVARAG